MDRFWDDELRDARGQAIVTGRDLHDEETGNYFVFRYGGEVPTALSKLADPTKDVVVSVVWSKVRLRRHGFHTQVSVQGNLQRHPDFSTKYRVMVSRSIYGYFDEADVVGIGGRPDKFKDGSDAVIFIA